MRFPQESFDSTVAHNIPIIRRAADVRALIRKLRTRSGTLAPRSVLDSDAPRIGLGGAWVFRFSPTLRPQPDVFEDLEFEDGSWDRLPVPSHWQLHGCGRPVYLSTSYQIPVDPPFAPDANE